MNGRQKRTPKTDSSKGSRAEFKAKQEEKIVERKKADIKKKKDREAKRKKNHNAKPSSQQVQKLRAAKEKGHLWATK